VVGDVLGDAEAADVADADSEPEGDGDSLVLATAVPDSDGVLLGDSLRLHVAVRDTVTVPLGDPEPEGGELRLPDVDGLGAVEAVELLDREMEGDTDSVAIALGVFVTVALPVADGVVEKLELWDSEPDKLEEALLDQDLVAVGDRVVEALGVRVTLPEGVTVTVLLLDRLLVAEVDWDADVEREGVRLGLGLGLGLQPITAGATRDTVKCAALTASSIMMVPPGRVTTLDHMSMGTNPAQARGLQLPTTHPR
jgi:hypothetical protein